MIQYHDPDPCAFFMDPDLENCTDPDRIRICNPAELSNGFSLCLKQQTKNPFAVSPYWYILYIVF